jgi:hypothetical protein
MKTLVMKNVNPQTPDHNTRFNNNKKRAENKDNLDSREGEEQQTKGNDVTHNKKEHKSGKSHRDRKEEKGRQ